MYNLQELKAPVLSGFFLKLAAWVFEKVSCLGLGYILAKDSNLFILRNKHIQEPATFIPLTSTAKETSPSNKELVEQLVKELKKINTRSVYPSILDFHRAFLQKSSTPSKEAEVLLEKLEIDGTNSMIKFNPKEIRAQAELSSARYEKKSPISVFDGVLFAVKDEMHVKEYLTSCGTSFLEIKSETDATIVARLKQLGAIVIGKTNMHEFGFDITNCNPNTGTPRNPHNPLHFTGGSSGGSASAVAAGLCPVSLGADAGGSIRIPSSFCGIYGLKPTTGRVSSSGSLSLAPSCGVLGPMAATAQDLCLTYAAIAGPDPNDPSSLLQPALSFIDLCDTNNLENLRIGIYKEYFEDCPVEIANQCYQVLDKLKKLGATIVPIEIDELEELRVAHTTIVGSELVSAVSSYPHKPFGYQLRLNAAILKSSLTPVDYLQASRMKTKGIHAFKKLFSSVDLIVTPTCATTAPKMPADTSFGYSDLNLTSRVMKYIFLANLLGLPAIQIPNGSLNGLPVGIQFMSEWFNERLLLKMALICSEFVEQSKPRFISKQE